MTNKTKKEVVDPIDLTEDYIESMIVNKIFSNYDYLALLLDNFDKRWFENRNIQTILNTMLNYYRKYNSLPTIDLLNQIFVKQSEKNKEINAKELSKELETALSLKTDTKSEDFIKESVLKYIKNKATYYAILDNLEDIEKNKNTSKCIERFQHIEGITFNTDIGFDYFNQLDKHLADVSNPEALIPLGFNHLDKLLSGGIYKDGRCLVMTMGQPGLGKSLMLGNLATNFLKQNLFPLIISLEMCEMVYGKRIDSQLSAFDITSLQHNIHKVKENIVNFKNVHKGARLLIKEFPPSTINCNHIQAYIEKLIKMNMYPDVIIVDYLNLLMPNKQHSGDNSYTSIGNVAKELRALSYIFKRPIISATQTNRSGYDTSDISMEHTSESAAINHHCDFLGALYQEDGDREINKMSMVILKNRLGGHIGKTVQFHVDYRTLALRDYSEIVTSPAAENDSVANSIIQDIHQI